MLFSSLVSLSKSMFFLNFNLSIICVCVFLCMIGKPLLMLKTLFEWFRNKKRNFFLKSYFAVFLLDFWRPLVRAGVPPSVILEKIWKYAENMLIYKNSVIAGLPASLVSRLIRSIPLFFILVFSCSLQVGYHCPYSLRG
jgi:hypothetical protein